MTQEWAEMYLAAAYIYLAFGHRSSPLKNKVTALSQHTTNIQTLYIFLL